MEQNTQPQQTPAPAQPAPQPAAPPASEITTMPQGAKPKKGKGRLILLLVILVIVAGGGYFWWQAGFSFDISRFFAAETGVMTVQCGATQNVITWTVDSRANSNSIQRGNNGAKNLPDCADYWCWLPRNNYPHQVPTTGTPAAYVDTQLSSEGVCYQYRIKYRPQLPSNSVFCPTNCNVAPTPTPTPTPTQTVTPTASPPVTPQPLACSPRRQPAQSGATVTIISSGGSRAHTWSAPGGNPSTGRGISFQTSFTHGGLPETRVFNVTVSDSSEDGATCQVAVQCAPPSCANPPQGCSYEGANTCECGTLVCQTTSPTPTPTPTSTTAPQPLSCAPASQTVNVGATATLQAAGGTGIYSWSSPGGTVQQSSSANEHRVSYTQPGGYTVTLSDGQNPSAQCTISVTTTAISPTPTPPPSQVQLDIDKVVRNITQGGVEAQTITASPGDLLEFRVRIGHIGSTVDVSSVHLRDVLDSRMFYVAGSTLFNGSVFQDGITSAAGINVGPIPAFVARTLTYRVQIAEAGTNGTGAFGSGTTRINNTIIATAPGQAGSDSSSASIDVVVDALPPAAEVPTGPGQATVMALIVSAIATLLYVGYTSTGMFRRREASDIARENRRHPTFHE